MEENIAGYKKDSKDYSKYKAEHYEKQTASKNGGNSTYFDTGHIKEVEEMDFSTVAYSDDFVGPLPNNGVRESDLMTNNEKLASDYQENVQNKGVLPDYSNDSRMKEFENQINMYQELYDATDVSYNELNGYVEYIKDYKTNALMPYQGMELSESEYQAAVELIDKNANAAISKMTNGLYTTCEEVEIDYYQIAERRSSIKGVMTQLERSERTEYYRILADCKEYEIYTPKYHLEETEFVYGEPNYDAAQEVQYEKLISFRDENGKTAGNTTVDHNLRMTAQLYEMSKYQEYINQFRENIESIIGTGALDILDFDYYKMYNYLLENYDEEIANKYIEEVQDDINCIKGLIQAAKFCSSLNNNSDVGATLENLLPAHFKGSSLGVVNSLEGLAAWLSDNSEKSEFYYEGTWILAMLSSGQFGDSTLVQGSYEVGQSIGNMAPSIALSAVNPTIGAVFLGLSSGGNTYRELRWQGEDRKIALLKGIITGCSEVLTERWLGSLPFLSEVKVTDMKTWIMSMIREGNQEVLQDIITSVLTNGDITVESLMKTWIIAGITSGELNLPGLALGKISRSNITEKNSLLKIETENGTIEIDTNEIAKYIKEHPDAKLEDVIKNFIGSNVESIDETISRFEANSEIEVQNIKDEILSGMPQGVDDLTKIRYLYLELNKRLSFDPAYNATPNGNSGAVESLRGNFNFENMINRFVVCKGWSQLFSDLVVSAGIDSSRVSIAGKGHYWVEIDLGDKILRADATDPQLSYHGIDLNASKYGENTNGFMLIDKSLSGVRIGVFDNIHAGIRGLVDEIKTYNDNYTWLRDIDESLGYTKDGKYYSERVKELESIFSDPSALETIFGGVTGEELTRAKINYLFEMDFGSTMSSEDARAYANQLLYALLDNNERGLVSVSRMYYASEGYNNYAGIFSIEIQNSDGSITARIISDNKDSTAGSSGTKCITKVFNNHEEYLDYLSSVGVGDSMLYSDDYY